MPTLPRPVIYIYLILLGEKKFAFVVDRKKKSHDITDSTLDNAGVTSALQSQYKPNFLLEIKILKILFEKKNEDARVTNLELV